MEETRKILRQRGTFRCADKRAEMCAALTGAGAVATLLVLLLSLFSFGEYLDMLLDIMVWVCAVMLVAAAVAWAVFGSGLECSYEARDTEFEVRGPKSRKEYFYYSDVRSVEYRQILRKGMVSGYTVAIQTGTRGIEYRFMFSPNAELRDTEHTPFYCLEVNSGLREESKLQIDPEAVLSQFESRQRSQRHDKTSKNERLADFFEGIDKQSKK